MSGELSPSLQEIHDRFIFNYTQGGLAAVEQMVEDLETEAQGAGAFAEAARDVEHDAIKDQAVLDTSEVVRTVDMSNQVTRDSTTALSRHSFALFLLDVVKNK